MEPDKKTPGDDMQYRASVIAVDQATGKPSTLDEKTRSVESVIATENPVRLYSYRVGGYFDEVLLMSGAIIPESGQVPLLDTHSRWDTAEIMGSCRGVRVEGDKLVGRDYFSTVPKAEEAWIKTKEGHLTARSAGFKYSADDTVKIDAGQTAFVAGRSFTAGDVPIVVVKSWELKENSICVIGKDDTTTTRSDNPATPQAEPHKKGNEMDPKVKAFLVTRGLPADATDDEAEIFSRSLEVKTEEIPPKIPATVPPIESGRAEGQPGDTTGKIQEGIRAERNRVSEITGMCDTFGIEDGVRAEMIDTGTTIEAARAKVMDIMVKKDTGSENIGFRTASVGISEAEKFMGAAGDALYLRAGMDIEKPAVGADELRGYTLVEMARACLSYGGERGIADPMQMVGRALTTSDFPNILANVASKTVMAAFDTQDTTWEQWCGTGSVSDFKEYTEVGVSAGGLLKVIKENGEYEFDHLEDEGHRYKIGTLGKMFRFSRESIINDDLNLLSKIGQMCGESAQRTLNRLAYMVLINNGALTDGVSLFHADHKNIGTAGKIAMATLDEAKRKMQLQRGIDGKERLNIKANFILAPTGAETEAEDFFANTVYDGTDKAATRKNRYNGTSLKRVYDTELDGDANNNTAWYLLGPKGKTVNMNFLNGNRKPYLESRDGWSRDGIEWKCRIDAGASVVSHKAMVQNAGA